MKKLLSASAPRLITLFFFIAAAYVLCYELWWMRIPAASFYVYKLGVLTVSVGYSTIAAAVFYYISVYIPEYLPREKKRVQVRTSMYHRCKILEDYVSGLKMYLNLQFKDGTDQAVLSSALQSVDPAQPVGPFTDWHQYLAFLQNRC